MTSGQQRIAKVSTKNLSFIFITAAMRRALFSFWSPRGPSVGCVFVSASMIAIALATSSGVRCCAHVKSSCSVMIFTSGPRQRRSSISLTQLV